MLKEGGDGPDPMYAEKERVSAGEVEAGRQGLRGTLVAGATISYKGELILMF